MAVDILLIIFLFFIGLFVGLLAIMIGLKFPIKKKELHNICDYCDNEYNVSELIPVISYFTNKGKCKYCNNELNIFYPVLETICGIMFVISYIRYGLCYEMFAMILLITLSTIIYVSDFKYYIINDSPLIVVSIILLLFKFVVFGFKTFLLSVISGLIMFIILYVIRLFGNFLFKYDTLGGGDIKLSVVFGITFGIRLSIVTVILGSFLAFPYAVYGSFSKKPKEIPFGPFLVTAFIIVFMWMDKIKYFLDLMF